MSQRRRQEAEVFRLDSPEPSPQTLYHGISNRDFSPPVGSSSGSLRLAIQGPMPQRKVETYSTRSLPGVAHSSPESIASTGYELHDPFYDRESNWRKRGPLSTIANIFTCWSRSRELQSGSFQGRSPRMDSFTATALVEQTRIQQEALKETEEARDMWVWLMEQQEAIRSQEHELQERNSSENTLGLVQAGEMVVRGVGAGLRRRSKWDEEEEEEAAAEGEGLSGGELINLSGGVRREEEEVGAAVVALFEAALLRCRWEVTALCRVCMQEMVATGFSLIRTLQAIEPKTAFLHRVHASYALEARISGILFRWFENDSFDETGVTDILDPAARALARLQEYARMKSVDVEAALRLHSPTYEPAFHSFCVAKSQEALALLPCSTALLRSAVPRDRFMDAFLRAAKCAWLLHRLATASLPPTHILRVGRGRPVDPLYIESVAIPPIGSCPRCPVTGLPKVEFMIMPGFITHSKVFRSKVYQHFMCKQ